MKSLDPFEISLAACRKALSDFKKLLDGRSALSERDEILPFFKKDRHLAALIGAHNPRINGFDRLASEFDLVGDFSCDLVIGDSRSRGFCFVEIENAIASSIFTKKKGKATSEWSTRFEHGFSQIIDWFRILEDQQGTAQFRAKFGADDIHYIGLLVIGRSQFLNESELRRLRWRSEQVRIGAKRVHCITFDGLYETLSLKLSIFGRSESISSSTTNSERLGWTSPAAGRPTCHAGARRRSKGVGAPGERSKPLWVCDLWRAGDLGKPIDFIWAPCEGDAFGIANGAEDEDARE